MWCHVMLWHVIKSNFMRCSVMKVMSWNKFNVMPNDDMQLWPFKAVLCNQWWSEDWGIKFEFDKVDLNYT